MAGSRLIRRAAQGQPPSYPRAVNADYTIITRLARNVASTFIADIVVSTSPMASRRAAMNGRLSIVGAQFDDEIRIDGFKIRPVAVKISPPYLKTQTVGEIILRANAVEDAGAINGADFDGAFLGASSGRGIAYRAFRADTNVSGGFNFPLMYPETPG